MELRDTARAADGFDLAVTRFPAEGRGLGDDARRGRHGRAPGFLRAAGPLPRRERRSTSSRSTTAAWAPRAKAACAASRRTSPPGRSRTSTRCCARRGRWAPGLPAFALGHSLGGQLFGVGARGRAARRLRHRHRGIGLVPPQRPHAACRCASSGSWPFRSSRRCSATSPASACAWWATCRAGVAWQWRRWCTASRLPPLRGRGDAAALRRGDAPRCSGSPSRTT